MNNLFLLCGLLLLGGYEAKPADSECVGVKIRNEQYEKMVVKDGLQSPSQMSVDHDTNTLFFSTTTDVKDQYQSKYIDLNTNKGGDVDGIVNGYASAVNSGLDVVYLGGKDGLYKYDYEKKKAVKFPVTDDNIKQMFFKDYLYYVNRDDNKVYFIDNGVKKIAEQLKDIEVNAVALDNDANLIYSTKSGLFEYNRDDKTTKKLGDFDVVGFAADIPGVNLYFTTKDSMYVIIFLEKKIEQLVKIGDGITGMAVDANNNLLYSTADRIVTFKKTGKQCSIM